MPTLPSTTKITTRNTPLAAETDDGPRRAAGLAFLVRSLQSRNYRLYFTGQGLSMIGTWMTRIALSWLVYRLTHSAALLGIVGFAGQIPGLLFGPFAGVLIDRVDKHRLLIVTQALAMVQSLALAALTLTHRINLTEIVLLSIFQGIINAYDMPARQSFVVQMVEKREDLSNAIALNSSMVNGARLIGPAIAGVVIAGIGEGWCFLVDGVSYIAVIVSLLMMVLPAKSVRTAGDRPRPLVQLVEGWRYVADFAPIRTVLLLLSIISIFGIPYTVLMPIFANQILHGGPDTMGILMAATGIGALGGAVYLASRSSVVGLTKIIPAAAALFGAGLIAFSFSRNLWLSVPLLMIAGCGFMVQLSSSNTLLQTVADEDKRGRVMSFYAMSFMGITPFGSLIAGVLASRIGAPHTLAISGCACLLGAAWFRTNIAQIRAALRPVYVRLGILRDAANLPATEVAVAVQS